MTERSEQHPSPRPARRRRRRAPWPRPALVPEVDGPAPPDAWRYRWETWSPTRPANHLVMVELPDGRPEGFVAATPDDVSGKSEAEVRAEIDRYLKRLRATEQFLSRESIVHLSEGLNLLDALAEHVAAEVVTVIAQAYRERARREGPTGGTTDDALRAGAARPRRGSSARSTPSSPATRTRRRGSRTTSGATTSANCSRSSRTRSAPRDRRAPSPSPRPSSTPRWRASSGRSTSRRPSAGCSPPTARPWPRASSAPWSWRRAPSPTWPSCWDSPIPVGATASACGRRGGPALPPDQPAAADVPGGQGPGHRPGRRPASSAAGARSRARSPCCHQGPDGSRR